jgi:myo-inositol 2-dehydrogenase / D-chiro-inositol 1-dehydrogenase
LAVTRHQIRLGVVGAGWINGIHLAALERLGRTRVVGIASAHRQGAQVLADRHGGQAYEALEPMLEEQRPDVLFVAVPPAASVAICRTLVERGTPFLVEKPLAATDVDGPAGLADAIAARPELVVAVGYQLRSLEQLPEVRTRLAGNPARLVTARWNGETPEAAWWRHGDTGGGQVVEQVTHLYDLARHLVGEATVIGATALREDPPVPEDADVADATAAILGFATGAIGGFVNTRRQAVADIEITFTSDGLATTIRKVDGAPGDWEVVFRAASGTEVLPPGRDPYERQAERFLDAVQAGDPTAVPCTYADALRTDRLTRSVVAATGTRP